MSSLATAPRRAKSESAEAMPVRRVRPLGVTVDAILGTLLAVAFGAVVFVAKGGTDLAPNTWIEIGVMVVGAGCALGIVLLRPVRPARTAAGATILLFAAVAALTYASIAWSVQPANSWVEANRTLAYLAAFGAGAALARLAPARWPAVVGAIGTVAVAACGYALLTKVFPATLDPAYPLGRLRAPFDYWNATGLMAALGLPACVWAGTRVQSPRRVRALTVPAIAILLTALILSYSRGAVLAVIIGLGGWLVLVPLRLRAAAVLALGALGAAIATVWAFSHHAITHDFVSLPARTAAGHHFGFVLLAVVALSALAGVALAVGMDRLRLTQEARRRIGIGLVVLVAMVPVGAVAGASVSSRGLTGEISHAWSRLIGSGVGVGNTPSRLAALGNSRPTYWGEGLKVGAHALLGGVGAGGFDVARTHYSTSTLPVAHAHSYLIETFADLGLIGVALSLGLLAAWGMACRRTFGADSSVRRRAGNAPPGATAVEAAGAHPPPATAPQAAGAHPPLATERAGLLTLLAIAVIFGVSSAIDWTWFIPGVAVPALVAAGWLAGRGPFAQTPAPPEAPAPATAAPPAMGAYGAARPLAIGRVAAAIGIVAATLVAGWFVWQPLHSSDEVAAAIDAAIRGDTPAALAAARSAAASDPVSVDPLWELSAIYQGIGSRDAARQELVKATRLQPENEQTWQQLGSFDLQAHRPRVALPELMRAFHLDSISLLNRQLVGLALSELGVVPPPRTGSA